MGPAILPEKRKLFVTYSLSALYVAVPLLRLSGEYVHNLKKRKGHL